MDDNSGAIDQITQIAGASDIASGPFDKFLNIVIESIDLPTDASGVGSTTR
jgi:hypothetical protein